MNAKVKLLRSVQNQSTPYRATELSPTGVSSLLDASSQVCKVVKQVGPGQVVQTNLPLEKLQHDTERSYNSLFCFIYKFWIIFLTT